MKNICLLAFLFSSLGLMGQAWEKKYDFVDEVFCGLSKIGKDGKIGYADKKGNEVIKVEYNEGLAFNQGMAAVRKGSKWMYFDSTGKAVIPAIYEDATSFESGLAAVAKNGLYGYINTAGDVVIDFQFSNARVFTEGLAPAANIKGNWGFIDLQGNWVIKPQYGFADNFVNLEARVMRGNKVFYVDKQNTLLHE